MPAFLKSPKFIATTVLVLWVAYVIYANFQFDAIRLYLLPFHILELQLKLSAIVIIAALFGAAVSLAIQFFWRRRSKNGSSVAGAAPIKKTVA